MESYGLLFKHNLIVEYILRKPNWTHLDSGRIIYDRSINRCFLGTFDSWESIGLYSREIKTSHIQLMTSDSMVSAISIPIDIDSALLLALDTTSILDFPIENYSNNPNYQFDTTSNVQFYLDGISNHMSELSVSLDSLLINNEYISDDLKFDNLFGLQINKPIDEILNLINFHSANDILLQPLTIGKNIGLVTITINDGISELIRYINEIESIDIIVDYENKDSILHDYLELCHDLIIDGSYFVKLIDIPDIEPIITPWLYTDSELILWNDITSNNIHVVLPDILSDNITSGIIDKQIEIFPNSSCVNTSIQNSFDLTSISYSPNAFYSTSLQESFGILREIFCSMDFRYLHCNSILIINTDIEFVKTSLIEQQKDDELCCVDNDNDLEWNLIYSTWHRFSHNYTDLQPADPTSVNSFSVDSTGIYTSANLSEHIGLVSFNLYVCYDLTVRVSSSTPDDDAICIVIAWVVDSNGWEHTLTAVRIHGSSQGFMQLNGVNFQWAIVYNYRQSSEWLVANGTNSTITCSDGWNNGYTIINVVRDHNIITCKCTNWNTDSPFVAPLIVDLDSDSRLFKFNGAKQYGFSAVSTQYATWKQLSSKCIPCDGSTNCKSLQILLQGAKYVNTVSELEALKSTNFDSNIYHVPEKTIWYWELATQLWFPYLINLPCGGDTKYAILPYNLNNNVIGDYAPILSSDCSQLDMITRTIYDIRDNASYNWNNQTCSWDLALERCPNLFMKNTIYYNDITCKIFWLSCENVWLPLN